MVVTINKSTANGVIYAPPSKSYAHRLLICAALSKKDSIIKNVDLSDDIKATINCLNNLGVIVSYNNHEVSIKANNNSVEDELVFDCNESGSTLRFLIPIALTTGKKVKFKGTKRLLERGIKIYEDLFIEKGIKVIKDSDSIKFEGKLTNGYYKLPGDVSSQYISGLLFALPLLDGESTIEITSKIESKNYIDITVDVLKQSSVNVEVSNNIYKINKSNYNFNNSIVEGDYSNASFFDCFNYLNGEVEILGLNEMSYQGDKVYIEYFKKLDKGYSIIDIKDCIDLGPVLFCFSALKHGGHFINTKRLKIKESDRILAVKEELEKFGVTLIEKENEVFIDSSNIHAPNEILDGHNDHRIVMSLVVMLSVYGGKIAGTNAINKSFPDFFEKLSSINIMVTYDD